MDRASVAKLAELDPEFEALQKTSPFPRLDWNDIDGFRAIRAKIDAERQASWGPPHPEVKEELITVTMRDGYESELKVFKPTSPPTEGSPLMVLCFGGGFVVGDNQQLTPFARAACEIFGATVVNISYRLAPENKFPAAHNDAWDSFKWIATNASSLGADPSKGFIIGGISAGGNLSAVIAQHAKDQGFTPPLTGVWLSVPLVFPTLEHVPEKYKDVWFSREQNADAPVLNGPAITAVHTHLQNDNNSKWYSPYNTKTGFHGLPKTYVQADGLDPLRDDALIHEQVLRESGVETRIDVYPGVPHAHMGFFPTLSITKKAIMDTFSGFAWLLEKKVTPEQVMEAMTAPGGS